LGAQQPAVIANAQEEYILVFLLSALVTVVFTLVFSLSDGFSCAGEQGAV